MVSAFGFGSRLNLQKESRPKAAWLINIPTTDCVQYIGVGLGGFFCEVD